VPYGQAAPKIEKNDMIIAGKSWAKASFYGLQNFLKGTFGFGVSKGLK
jgi:hypothetical protein